jgi:hypothetical protein
MTAATLARIAVGSSAEALARILDVLLPDARTALDTTWGNGAFWGPLTAHLDVTGLDRDPSRARDVCGDFTRLPFADGAFDVAIFDPPYLTEAGRESVVRRRFGSFASVPALRDAVGRGAAEAWRVSRLGVIVKVMDYCHASRLVRMTRWVEDAVPADLYDVVHLTSRSKVEDGKWSRVGGQLSVRSNATTWLVWRHDGAVHRRRRTS